MLDVSAVGIVVSVAVKKLAFWNISPRELSEARSFGIGTPLLVADQSSLGNRPRGVVCDIHRRIR